MHLEQSFLCSSFGMLLALLSARKLRLIELTASQTMLSQYPEAGRAQVRQVAFRDPTEGVGH